MYVTMFEPMRRGFAEFVGAFTLIFIGAGAILSFEKLFLTGFLSGGGQASRTGWRSSALRSHTASRSP